MTSVQGLVLKTDYSMNFMLSYFFKYFDWMLKFPTNQSALENSIPFVKLRCKIFIDSVPGADIINKIYFLFIFVYR